MTHGFYQLSRIKLQRRRLEPKDDCNEVLDAVCGGSGVSISVGVVDVAADIAVVVLKMFLLLILLFQGVMVMLFSTNKLQKPTTSLSVVRRPVA